MRIQEYRMFHPSSQILWSSEIDPNKFLSWFYFNFRQRKMFHPSTPRKKTNQTTSTTKKRPGFLNTAGFFGGFSGRPSTNSTRQLRQIGCSLDVGVTQVGWGWQSRRQVKKSDRFGKPKKQRLDEPNVRRTEIARGTRVKLDIPSPQSMMSYKPQSWGWRAVQLDHPTYTNVRYQLTFSFLNSSDFVMPKKIAVF